MKFFCTLLVCCGMLQSLQAQNKKLSLEESMTNPAFSMPLRQIHGFADGSWAVVVGTPAGGEALVRYNGDRCDTLAFAREWAPETRRFPQLVWKSPRLIYGIQGSSLDTFSLRSRKAAQVAALPADAASEDIEPGSLAVAFCRNHNLWIARGSQLTEVTRETDPNIVSGQAVHRNEYGIEKGTFWSPDGKLLAFYRMDQRMVTDYPIVEIGEKPAKVRNIKYPMAGQTSHEVQVGVYNLATGSTAFLKVEGPKDQYLTGITWTPDSRHITLTVLNRETSLLRLQAYDASTGLLYRTLLEEKSDRYLDPQEGPLFYGRNNEFIWQSERSGCRHLYAFDWTGKLLRRLSAGEGKVTRVLGTDATGTGVVYVQASASGMDFRAMFTRISNGKTRELTPSPGSHNPVFCDGNARILDVWSSLGTPRQIDLADVATGKTTRLKTFSNPFDGYDFPRIDTFSLRSTDGQVLNCRMILPPGFDEKRKYPAIVYVYGGPHAQMVTNSWMAGAAPWMAAWASDGFVVFTLDNRGSYNRNVAFEQAPYRNLGTPELEDQVTGIRHLKNLPFIEGSRIGVHGWSYGGFMTTTLMARAPGICKVGIAGAPVIDWSMYEIMYTERYMDTPAENPEGYRQSNLMNHASAVKGKLMLIHGTSDDVVVWQHTQSFLQKAIQSGVQLDYFIYPGHGHGVGGRDRLHLMKKMLGYFKDYL